MSESAFGLCGGESAGRGFFGESRLYDVLPSPERTRSNQVPVSTTHQRVIRAPAPIQQNKQQEPICDIGGLRQRVMEDLCEELYKELYGEIKADVKAEVLKQKPEIVREIAGELRERLKTELRSSLIQGEGGGR